MLNIWRWYQNNLETNPVKTQMISSAALFGVGDIAAQTITFSTSSRRNKRLLISEKDNELKINWKRVAATSLFGFGFVGPFGHLWYEGLDRVLKTRLGMKENSFRFVATKVAVDGIIFAPLDLLVFFTYMGFVNGKAMPQIKEDVKRDFIPALAMEGGIWPIVQIANFRFIPVKYQLLYVNLFCLMDSCFLSWIEQQDDAAWKKWFSQLLKEQKGKGE